MEVMSDAAKRELHDLVDSLPSSEVVPARRYLEFLRDQSDPQTHLDHGGEMDAEDEEKLRVSLKRGLDQARRGEGRPVEEFLAELKEHGGSEALPHYVEGRLAIAEEALSRAAALRGDLFTMHDAAAYALETVRELRAQWAFGAHPALEASSVEGLAIVEGGLRSEGGPLFLGGLAIDADSAQVRRVAEYRLNFATVYVASGDRSSLREIADAAGSA